MQETYCLYDEGVLMAHWSIKAVVVMGLLMVVFLACLLVGVLWFVFVDMREDMLPSEHVVEEYIAGDYNIMKYLRDGNATVGFYHVFYCSAMGMTNILLVTRARNLEPKCTWLKKGTALIEPLNPSEILFVEQEVPWFKCATTNEGNALCVDFNVGK